MGWGPGVVGGGGWGKGVVGGRGGGGGVLPCMLSRVRAGW